MITVSTRRRMAGGLGLLAAILLTGCSASPASSPAASHAAPAHSRAAAPAASASAAPVTATSSTPAAKDGILNLAMTQDVRTELIAAYADYVKISPADIAGIAPRSAYYAYDPAAHTYWAKATFEPSSTASFKVLVGFQDGANVGMFARQGSGGWQVRIDGEPPVCNEVRFFPHAVLLAWSLSTDTAAWGC